MVGDNTKCYWIKSVGCVSNVTIIKRCPSKIVPNLTLNDKFYLTASRVHILMWGGSARLTLHYQIWTSSFHFVQQIMSNILEHTILGSPLYKAAVHDETNCIGYIAVGHSTTPPNHPTTNVVPENPNYIAAVASSITSKHISMPAITLQSHT